MIYVLKRPLLISSLTLSFLAACGKPAPAPEQQAVVAQPATTTSVASLSIHNPSDFARVQEAIYVSAADLGLTESAVQNSAFIAATAQGQLPSQWIDRNADGQKDTLLISPTLSAGETLAVQITAGTTTELPKQTQAEISQKTGGQWQDKKYIGGSFENVKHLTPPPQYTDHSEFIRYEGPGIESDKVAYRIYLDWRNGFDIFGNKTGKPVLDQIGQDGYSSYHEPADWGMDVLKVGKAVGAGGFGYWDGSQVERVSKLDGHTVNIIENGALYSALTIDYKNWQIAGKTLDIRAHLSMTAGSRLLQNRLTLSQPLDNLALGIVKLPDTKLLTGTLESSGHTYTYLATYGKQSLDGANLGMAILFKRGKLKELTTDEHNHVAVMSVSGQHLEYYLLGAWQHELNGITNEQQFVEYLQQEVERLTLTPRLSLKTEFTNTQISQPMTSERALYWSQQLANSELNRQAGQYYWGGWDTERDRPVSFEYTTGLLIQAFDDLNKYGADPAYQAVIRKMADTFVTEDGTIHSYDASKFNIDSINSGNLLLRVFEQTKEPKYQLAAQALREQLKHHPKTSNGAFWHKNIYPHQLWLDGVYMGMPFLAYYSSLFEQGASLDQAVHEFVVTREQLRDDKTGLYFHAWDESKQMDWADKETGRSAYFWGRAIGWLAMALVDVLDYIPADNTELRQPLLNMVTELAADLAKYQDAETGVWYQIMDKAGERGNYLESSGSSMFVYFYAKAINKGYLPKEQYLQISKKAWQGLLNEFVLVHPDGSISLTNMVQVAGLGAGRDGSYHYYMSEPIYRNDSKGTGPFIMAGVQMAQLLKD
ncbi:glycoside hydrolase family 88 protein [Rheinheimera soli]|uniref:glycoside hydrolase family 88 protein n=1 Tax=Rheinheimera soli TaxID=443616 RepID=UPI001E4F2343